MKYFHLLGTILLQIFSVSSDQYAVVFPDDNYVAETNVAADQVYYVHPESSQGM